MNVKTININFIKPNADQPRKHFDEEKLAELAISIAQYGVLQPIIVSDNDDGTYQIIAGERRYRACVMAGVGEVPVIVSDANRYTADRISIIENVQRDDLSAIEEALAYKSLIDLYELSQGEIGRIMGKKPSTISNKIRLLKLNDDVKEAIATSKISERHGRAMLNLEPELQSKYLQKVVEENLTVKDLERELEKVTKPKPKKNKTKSVIASKDFRLAINTIKEAAAMIERTGMSVDVNEEMDGDNLVINLKVSRG